MWKKLEQILSSWDPDQFHFLRPGALYLFIALGVIGVLLVVGNRDRKKWKKIIVPSLRPFMFTKGSGWAMVLPLLSFAAGIALCILSLAGPAWKKKSIPAEKIQAVVVVGLDLSRSMLAKDIQPDRLERAKLKIGDLLAANPRAGAGLIAYAGSAHPVLPFTGDYKLITHHAASLFPRIMPVQGTDVGALLDEVDTMMKNVQAPSTILLMTDAITSDQAVLLGNYIHGSRHHLEILLFSTPEGAKVPGFPQVVSRQDPAVLRNLSQDSAITITPLTLDKSDVEGIAKRIASKLTFEKSNGKNEKEWDDMGWLLLPPAMLFVLIWFRRGWAIQWCWLGVIVSCFPSCGIDGRHPDWWYSKDYQGQLLENKARYEPAAERFEDERYKAIAYFKAGNYAAAADLFALDSSASAAYNRGLALARLSRYDEALRSFNKAIDLDPSLASRADSSISRTRSDRQKADSLLRMDPQKVSGEIKKVGKDKKEGPLKERKAQAEDEQLSSDTRVKKLPTSGNRVTDEVASNIHMGKEAKSPPKDLSIQKHMSSGEQILMRQTSADPSEFLHRRFELQMKRNDKAIKKSKEPW